LPKNAAVDQLGGQRTGEVAQGRLAGRDGRGASGAGLVEHVEVRCCRLSQKSLHAKPGDVLIDDWEKYRRLSRKAGGRWITHRNAAETISELEALGL
jgi:hypothetical protein